MKCCCIGTYRCRRGAGLSEKTLFSGIIFFHLNSLASGRRSLDVSPRSTPPNGNLTENPTLPERQLLQDIRFTADPQFSEGFSTLSIIKTSTCALVDSTFSPNCC
jgi:hypothetical protein